ncbi:MAG: hypothetical protein H7832_15280 [Magnetococcus sp. DMHC-6]
MKISFPTFNCSNHLLVTCTLMGGLLCAAVGECGEPFSTDKNIVVHAYQPAAGSDYIYYPDYAKPTYLYLSEGPYEEHPIVTYNPDHFIQPELEKTSEPTQLEKKPALLVKKTSSLEKSVETPPFTKTMVPPKDQKTPLPPK